MSLVAELQRRNVIRVAIAYLVFGWLVMQVLSVVGPILELPAWVLRLVLVMMALGFVGVLAFSWAYELTPEGLKRESQVDRGGSITHHTARKLDIAVIVLIALALGVFVYDRFVRTPPQAVAPVAAVPATSAPAPKAEAPVAASKSIAVLPFVNMSSDPEQTYLSDGIAEELLNALVKLPGLKVAGRTSSFAFRDKADDLRAIGKALSVEHILEGSVRKQGTRVRITAQLVKAEDGFHLWSETYERDVSDIFALQDEITRRIVDALQVTLGQAPSQSKEISVEAYALYLQARQQFALRGIEALGRSKRLFQQVVALEPDYAPAWAGLSRAAELEWVFSFDDNRGGPVRVSREEALRTATDAVEKALALDPDNAEAWSARAHIATNFEGDWDKGRDAHERAMALAPNDSEVLNFAGDYFYWVLDPRSLEIETRAATLDPMLGVNHFDVAMSLHARGQHERALASARKAEALGLFERSPYLRANAMIPPLIALRRFDEAREVAAQLAPAVTKATRLSLDIWIASASGDAAGARELASQLLSDELADERKPRLTAQALLWAGRPADALPFLEQAIAIGDLWLVDPLYLRVPEQLTDDPAVRALLERPPYKALFEIRRRNLGLPPVAPP
jgi:TolB-like protein/Tfp pilus assembly protein PilF